MIQSKLLLNSLIVLAVGFVTLSAHAYEAFQSACFPDGYTPDPNDEPLYAPPAPLTGIEREKPIVLMTRKEFNERIRLSPLWESLYDKELEYGSYGSSYSFKTLGELMGANSYIRVTSHLDGHYWKESQRLTQLSYGNHDLKQRNQYHHQLLEQERIEMIETLKLAIDNIDDKTASEIIDKLYEQYMDKVNNKAYLSDGQTIHTYIEYDGKFIAFRGKVNCKYDMFTGMTID
ncbi:MAG: hypothetical protein ACTJFK_03290 [Psychrobacter sp.]